MNRSILVIVLLVLGGLACKGAEEQSGRPPLRRGSEKGIFEWMQLSDQWQAEAQEIADPKFTGLRVSVSSPHDILVRYGLIAPHAMLQEIEKMALFAAEKTASVPWESGEVRIEFTVYRGGHPDEDYVFRMSIAACREALRLSPAERRTYLLQHGTVAIRSGTEWTPADIAVLADTTTSSEEHSEKVE